VTRDEILSLIDECRKRGVAHLKLEDVEFSLYREGAGLPDLFPELSETKLDPAKCVKCQNAPRDGRITGFCRACAMGEAGVVS
jgi:hypothetical protein